MFTPSSTPISWFSQKLPDLYFWIISIIAFVVFVSSIKLFINMQRKHESIRFKIITWQKWILLGVATGLLAIFVSESIYRYDAWYGVSPAYTSYAWKYYLFTSSFGVFMIGLWIFKGIINGQFISWKEEFNGWSIVKKFNDNKASSKAKVESPKTNVSKKIETNVKSPVSGKLKAIEKIADKVFSSKAMGDGIAITPSNGKIASPISGTVESAFHTGHAFGIKSDDGLSILIHIGIDTVKLKGKGFKGKIKQGQKIKAGDIISEVDLDFLKKEKYNSDVIVLVLPESKRKIKFSKKTGAIVRNKNLFKVI